jgi:hypothetical protein
MARPIAAPRGQRGRLHQPAFRRGSRPQPDLWRHTFRFRQPERPRKRQTDCRVGARAVCGPSRLMELLDGEAETITRKAIELAKDGDLPALRLCLDRIAPPRKDRPVLFELPPVSSAADAAKAAAALLEAVAVGDLTPAEASELGKLIEAYITALEATDFAERLASWSG